MKSILIANSVSRAKRHSYSSLPTIMSLSLILGIAGIVLCSGLLLSTNALAQDTESVGLVAIDSIDNVAGEAPSAASNVFAKDTPNDKGKSATVTWDLSPEDTIGGIVDGYLILRSESPSGPFVDTVGNVTIGKTEALDNNATDGVEYYYRVDMYRSDVAADGSKLLVGSPSTVWGPTITSPQWFHSKRGIMLFIFLIVAFSILQFISQAQSGKSKIWMVNILFIVLLGYFYSWVMAVIVAITMVLFIKDFFSTEEIFLRKIGGIEAVEEAIGRATEMGKKIFFIPGIQDMNDVQTIAGMAILGRIAAVAAEYETWLEVPVSKSMVMVTARETMKEAYSRVGRPEMYQEAQVHFVTEDQFGYAAALDGMFVREKPATIFFMGAFFAESLILAETGNEVGAIQIAGTAMPSQLPFFVAACDYTLLGEELFAASAYLSREPRQLGSLKGQDVGKALFLVAMMIGLVVVLAGEVVNVPDWMYLAQYFSID